MNVISINGVTIASGRNITVTNGRVIVDGNDVTPESKEIRIDVKGPVERVEVDACNTLSVVGNAGVVSTVSGDVHIDGDVSGSVQTVSGDIACGKIAGSVSTVSGDVRDRR